MELPKTIFVRVDGEGEDSYFLADENVDDVDNGEVGVYELQKIVIKTSPAILTDKAE